MSLEQIDAADDRALGEIARYIQGFLQQPHALLGRQGPVCPFARGASRGGHLRLTQSTVRPGEEARLFQDVIAASRLFDAQVRVTEPASRIFVSLILALPGMEGPLGAQTIEQVQRRCKPRFVRRGAMIGQFYPGCPAPGLHAAEFRPFDAPAPFIAIRHMTAQDAPFLIDEPEWTEAFRMRFGALAAIRLDAGEAWAGH